MQIFFRHAAGVNTKQLTSDPEIINQVKQICKNSLENKGVVALPNPDDLPTVFTHPQFGRIRTIEVGDNVWFVGKDVAEALGYAEPRSAVSKRVEVEDRGVAEMETPSGKQQMTIINESGLYSLILSSKLPTAKEFKRWVTSEVLPSIRKTGGYVNSSQSDLFLDTLQIRTGKSALLLYMNSGTK